MLSGYKNSLENILRILESTGKVLEFRVSNTVGTMTSASSCRFVWHLSCHAVTAGAVWNISVLARSGTCRITLYFVFCDEQWWAKVSC